MLIGLNFAEQPNSIGMHQNMAARTSGKLRAARLVRPRHAGNGTGRRGPAFRTGRCGRGDGEHSQIQHIGVLQLVAFISINLGVMNLLPLPAPGRRAAGIPADRGGPPQAGAAQI